MMQIPVQLPPGATKEQTEEFQTLVDFVVKAHEGQVDKAGVPYFHHVVRVANSVITPTHKVLALMHDLLEDTNIGEDDLFRMGFDFEVIGKLKKLRRDRGQPYDEYISMVITDFDTAVVKLADLRDNMDLTRLEELTNADIKRTRKYHKAYRRVLHALDDYIKQEADHGTEH